MSQSSSKIYNNSSSDHNNQKGSNKSDGHTPDPHGLMSRLGNGIKELKLGQSFQSSSSGASGSSSSASSGGKKKTTLTTASSSSSTPSSNTTSFHTIRYDFKPASVDTEKMAKIEFGQNNKVTVTAPNIDGSGHPETVFEGSVRPHLKDCVLIINHETDEIILEKLHQNIQVKNKRVEGASKSGNTLLSLNNGLSVNKPNTSGQKALSPFASNSGSSSSQNHQLTPNGSGPTHHTKHHQSDSSQNNLSTIAKSSTALNRIQSPTPAAINTSHHNHQTNHHHDPPPPDVPMLSESSSDDDDDDDANESSPDDNSENDSSRGGHNKRQQDSSDDDEIKDVNLHGVMSSSQKDTNHDSQSSFGSSGLMSMPKFNQLNDDLRLSESGSDSD